jgi:pilus assembly protein CpaB
VSRRRRGFVLLGLALVLGGVAAADVSRREAALAERLQPLVPVVVARQPLGPGTEVDPGQLSVRRVPARFAPPGTVSAPAQAAGLRTAVQIPAGGFLTAGQLSDPAAAGRGGPGLRRGERVADVVAVGSPQEVAPGARVDVLVTREGRDGGAGRTSLALEDVEVLAAAPAAEDDGAARPADAAPAPRVAASLRVTVRQAVYLAAAQSFAREIRLLARAPGDRARGSQGVAVDAGLG